MKERSPLLQRSILALLSAEIISSLGAQMTFLALPWFVLTTTGSTTRMGIVLAAELLPIALLGIPSGTVVTRLGAVKAMLVCDLARIPLMVSIPLLYEAGHALVPAVARARLRARLLHRAVLLRPADRAAGAGRRGLGDAHAGERLRRGRLPAHDPPRARRRRAAHRVDRRRQRPLRGRGDVRRLVLSPALLRAQAPPGAGYRRGQRRARRACASSCSDGCCGRCSPPPSSCTCSRRRSSSRCRCLRTTTTAPARGRPG